MHDHCGRQSGQEQTFKSVQEVLYPTRYDAAWGVFTNDSQRAVTAAVIKLADFEMRESGVIFTCLPERFEETDEITWKRPDELRHDSSLQARISGVDGSVATETWAE